MTAANDGTPKLISGYVSKLGDKAKSFRTPWKGLGHARNLIVDNADGEYVLFVDATKY